MSDVIALRDAIESLHHVHAKLVRTVPVREPSMGSRPRSTAARNAGSPPCDSLGRLRRR